MEDGQVSEDFPNTYVAGAALRLLDFFCVVQLVPPSHESSSPSWQAPDCE